MPVSVEKQVAVTLYYLSDEGRYRKVANAFGLAKCTVSVIVRRACTVISTVQGPQYITLPKTENELVEAVQQFYSKHGFPQCFGAVDGTHIFIKQPNKNATDSLNRKNRFSVIGKPPATTSTVSLLLLLNGQRVYMILAYFTTLL